MINQFQIKSKNTMKCKRKVNDYTTGCLLDYQYFKDHYQLIAVDLSTQEEDAHPRAIQQIEFYRKLETNHKRVQC